jgi:hypothetical protein
VTERFRTMRHGTVTAVRRIGRGAAAEVWTIAERKDLVLKLYVGELPPEEEAKMRDLISAGFPVRVPGFPHLLAAWPQDIAFDGSGAMVGLLVPRAKGDTKFSVLAYPSEREKRVSNLSYELVLRWVHGACVLTSFVHHHGVVLCDANGRNFLGGGRGAVSLIDLDSAQFSGANGRLWRSPWFSVEYLAPELHGVDLRKTARTAAHDDFAVFVLVFEMLFCGRGPFDGVHGDPSSTPSLRAREGQFAYAGTVADFQPPPMAPSWNIVGPELAAQFHRAFSVGSAGASQRPTVKELGDGISATISELVKCGGPRTHYYPRSARGCPWCSYEQRIGIARAVAPRRRRKAARGPGPPAPRQQQGGSAPNPLGLRPGHGARTGAVAVFAIVLLATLVLAIVGGNGDANQGTASAPAEPVAAKRAVASPPEPNSESAAARPRNEPDVRVDPSAHTDAPARTLRRHFRLLNLQRPMAAFRLFVPSYRKAVNDWVALRRAARPRLRIVRIRTVRAGGGTADAQVLFYARDTLLVRGSDRHCRRFSGTAHMRRISGAWFYDPESGALDGAIVSRGRCP